MSISSHPTVIVLAAGKGTRMKSDKAKVLHEVYSAPMLHHVLNAITPLHPEKTIVIVGHQREAVIRSLAGYDFEAVTQEEQLGTGHAVRIAEHAVPANSDTVMILCGDTPLIRSETLKEMYAYHTANGAALTLMTTILKNPTNYGRIISDGNNRLQAIVEQKDATPDQLKIREINAGIYCVNTTFLFKALQAVGTDNSQGEVYLTDIVSIAVNSGLVVEKFVTPYAQDVLGVNSRVELAEAHSELHMRRNKEIMLQGVTIQSPETVCISSQSSIGKDSLIMNGVHIEGNSSVGSRSVLMPGVILSNCIIGDNVEIGPYSVLRDCTVTNGTIIAPHSTSP